MNSLSTALLFAVSVFLANPSVSASDKTSQPKVAIIIDDLGYKLSLGRKTINLPHPITLAIIPSSPYASVLAQAANCQAHKEVLVHLPMTPLHQAKWEPGLNSSMTKSEFSQAATAMLQSLPQAIGVNNHGGSLLTQDRQRMAWLMDVLAHKSLFFIDSRTSPLTVAAEIAHSSKLRHNSRDIFLDNQLDEAAIVGQLNKLVLIAREKGHAIAIGHPHPETINVLQKHLPELLAQGIKLVGVSSILRTGLTPINTSKGE